MCVYSVCIVVSRSFDDLVVVLLKCCNIYSNAVVGIQLFNLFDGADGGGVDDDVTMTPGVNHFGCLCPSAEYAQNHPVIAAN